MYGGTAGASGGVAGAILGGGAVTGAGPDTLAQAASAAGGSLAFTGFAVAEVAVAGFVLLAAGQALGRVVPKIRGGRI